MQTSEGARAPGSKLHLEKVLCASRWCWVSGYRRHHRSAASPFSSTRSLKLSSFCKGPSLQNPQGSGSIPMSDPHPPRRRRKPAQIRETLGMPTGITSVSRLVCTGCTLEIMSLSRLLNCRQRLPWRFVEKPAKPWWLRKVFLRIHDPSPTHISHTQSWEHEIQGDMSESCADLSTSLQTNLCVVHVIEYGHMWECRMSPTSWRGCFVCWSLQSYS